MKIEKTLLDDHQVQLTVEVDGETFDSSKRRAARKISRDHKVPGFRPGKAPYNVVVRQFGEGAVIEEALEFLVDDIYPKLLEGEEITPYGPGTLKEVKKLDPPELAFVIPLAPSVELGDYRSIRLEYTQPEVTDENVQGAIDNLLEREAKSEVVDRPSAVGDRVFITLHGHEQGDEAKKLVVDLHRTPVVIEPEDADTSTEWPFPGFSHALAGLEKGATKEFTHAFPEDYDRDEEVKGKTIDFHVTIEEVRTRELPELNDDFAKTIGEYETVDDLREDARKQLEATTRDNYDEDYRRRALEQIVAGASFKFPPQMLDDELDEMVNRFKQRIGNEGWDLETYLKMNDKDEAALREEFREAAESRIRRGLAVLEIANLESIQVMEREVQQEVQRTVDFVNSAFEPQRRREILNEDFLRGLVSSAMRDALTERTLARVAAIARGEAEEEAAESSAAEAGAPDLEIGAPDEAEQSEAVTDTPAAAEAAAGDPEPHED